MYIAFATILLLIKKVRQNESLIKNVWLFDNVPIEEITTYDSNFNFVWRNCLGESQKMIENIILWHHDVFARCFMVGVSSAAHSESSFDVSDCHNWRLSDDEIGLAHMVAQGWLLRVTSVVKGGGVNCYLFHSRKERWVWFWSDVSLLSSTSSRPDPSSRRRKWMTAYVVHLMYSERAMASALRNYSNIQGASGSEIYKSRPVVVGSCVHVSCWYVLREKTSDVVRRASSTKHATFRYKIRAE